MKFPVIVGAALVAGSGVAVAFTSRNSAAIRSTSTAFANNFSSRASTRSTTAAYATPMEFAKAEIASNDVVVFSKAYCPFCTRTKQLLESMNIEAKVIELDQRDDGNDIQAAVLDISGQRTVPNVFIKGKHLGGNDDTQAAARSGKLVEMLES
jgi:glutaredoxin 3